MLSIPVSPRRRWIGAATVLAAVTGVALLGVRGCTPRVEPLPPSEFATCTLETLPDRQPIGEVFEMAAGSGTYAEIRIRPLPSWPAMFHDAAVQPEPAKNWPVSLWIYPVGKEMTDGYCAPTPRYRGTDGKPPLPFLSKGSMAISPDSDFKGPLPRPKDHPMDPDLIVCWTYLQTIPGYTGDLLYELSVYPTAIPSKGGQHKYGKRAIIQRGVLRVRPESK